VRRLIDGRGLLSVVALCTVFSGCLATSDGGAQRRTPHPTTVARDAVPKKRAPTVSASSRFFAPTSVWNVPLAADAPLDPQSPLLVATLLRQVTLEVAAQRGPYVNTIQYSTPVYTVRKSQRRVPVQLDTYTPSRLQRAFRAVPLPNRAHPADGTDAHLTVWQPSTDRMWEFWKLQRRKGRWHAAWGGAMRKVSRRGGYYKRTVWPGARSYWGATATSLPLVGGLIRINELRAGRVDHALALGLPEIRSGVFSLPAQRTDGTVDRMDAIPAGARFRLDPTLDLSTLQMPPFVRVLAEAAQKYGMIVRDTSGAIAFYGEDPRPRDPNPYPRLIGPAYDNGHLYEDLAQFPWDRLQLVRMRLQPVKR
jgi:hypothetical protein